MAGGYETLLHTLGSQVRASSTLSEDQSPLPSPRALSPAQTCTLLKMNLQMLASMGGALHPSTALKHLHFASPFSNLRLQPNHSISRAVAATYLFFLQHSSPKVAHESHLCLRKELELLSGMLACKGGGATTLESFKDGGVSDSEIITLMRFDVTILLVSLREYTPESTSHAREFASFLLETLNPFTSPVQRFVELQLAVAQALRRVFSWISPENEEFVGVMCRGLHPNSSLPLKLEVLDWVRELPASGSMRIPSGVISSLVSAASDPEAKVREQVARAFHHLLEKKCLSSTQILSAAGAAFEQLSDPEPGVQAGFSRLLSCCGSAAALLGDDDSSSAQKKNWRYLLSVKRFSSHLSPPQVLEILNFVFQRPQALPSGWLQRLVFSSLKSVPRRTSSASEEKSNELIPLDDTGLLDLLRSWCSSSNTASAWFVIQELARHCVSVRFRTHLGGPTQTFATLERMLLDLPGLAGSEQVAGSQLLPMRLLLELVESLQRNIYNAFEGSLVLEPPPSSSIHFFRANKKVCEEWFARIREPLVNASGSIQCHFGSAHYSVFRLIDLRALALSALRSPDNGAQLKAKLQQDVSRALRHGSLALAKLREGDAILGLQSWVVTAFGAPAFEDGGVRALGWMNGLALEARGELERAAGQYMQLLQSEESLSAMGAEGVQFTIARLVESYASLSDWEALESWLVELQALRTRHAGKPFTGALTTAGIDMNWIHAWATFDAGDVEGTWGYLDLTPQSSCQVTLDPRLAIQRSEQMILQAMLRKEGEREEIGRELKLARGILEGPLIVSGLDGFPEASPFLAHLHCIDLVESWRGFSPEVNRHAALHDTAVLIFDHQATPVSGDCHLWLKLLRVYKAAFSESGATVKLREQLIRLARKHHNFRLARRLLSDAAESSSSEIVHYENSRLLFSEGDHHGAITSLWSLVNRYTSELQENGGAVEENSMASTACLKLASWLRKTRLEPGFFSALELGDPIEPGSGVELAIELMGAANKAATSFSKSSRKAWFSYANWCYLNARGSFFGNEVVSRSKIFPGMLDEELVLGSPSLTSEELSEVQWLISGAVSEEVAPELEATIVEMLVKRVSSLMESAAGDPGFEKWDGDSPAIVLGSQLRQELQLLKPATVVGLIAELMQVWWGVRRRRVAMVAVAARGFLKYLAMASGGGLISSRGDSTLNASLYVLRILQAFGVELEEDLQQGLRSVPPSAWQEITPQLFACLSSHPEAGVRKQLEGLLISLANVYPSAIVYPTLVHLSASEGQSSQELEHILSSLVKLHPKVVNDVRLMIAELGSITFLWEEQWLTTIQDLHADVTRRLSTLKEEAARIAENQTLSTEEKARINAAKYSAIMAPVAFALERRLSLTSRPPETPHEIWFQEHFLGQLRSAIASFKSPPVGGTLTDAWKPFDAIATSLANHHKRSAVLLRDISPRLAALRHSDAPMPGLEASASPELSVEGFSEQVVILATKTKPKKLSVTGSDGRLYTYLLKGREDLRLDARIMQLLRASNRMLVSSGKRDAIRCYSVTPISGRAGLIQWVDNVTSLYSVYKAWQLRAATQQQQQQGTSAAAAVPRPSDMFYGKLIPALKSRKVVSRRDWPQDVKRKVLVELMKETPSQILYRELWCASDGLKGFHSKIKRYSSSVAVMSMIGYVLGLGDRHLDNILIDFSSGEVVHIDYNICFEKGLRLKVPEIVPFRLTQIMQTALGPTGVEGSFRADCEAVLRALHKNKELILMLLEAFIWDPLVEWLRGDGHDEATIGGEERKGMELAVSLSLFASHVQENRVALQEHHDELLWNLPVVATTLQAWLSGYEKFERCSISAIQANDEKLKREKAELTAKTYLSEASAALEKAHLNYELQARELTQTKSLISEAARETSQWIEQRTRILDSLRNDTASELQALTQLAFNTDAVSLLPAVQASGVSISALPEPIQSHCSEVDKDVSQFAMARHEALLHAGITLQAYSRALQRLLPGNYHTTSFVHSWAQVFQLLSRQIGPEVLGVSKRQGLEIIARNRGEHDEIICQKHDKLRRRVEQLAEEVQKLEQEKVLLEKSLDPEAERRAKERLVAIFVRSLQKRDDEDDRHPEERKVRVLAVLRSAAATFYKEIGEKVTSMQSSVSSSSSSSSSQWCFAELEELGERCVLVSDVLREIQEVGSGRGFSSKPHEKLAGFTGCLIGVDHLVKQMLGVVLPEAVKAALSRDPAVIEAFSSVSQIRGALDSALEQAASIESQCASLMELESSYPERIEEVLRRQESLERAAAGGRDDLSWEEAEELATQEESCKEQLEKLQSAWAHRGVQAAGLRRLEELVEAALEAAEERFEALVALESSGDLHLMRGKVLLAAFANLFSGLEALDSPLGAPRPGFKGASSSSPGIRCVWRATGVLKERSFFVWKLYVIDSLLEACLRDAAGDLSLSLDQLINQQRRHLEALLQSVLDVYLRQRLAPALLEMISGETLALRRSSEEHQLAEDGEPLKKALRLLREYCDVHESVRAAKFSASSLRAQAEETSATLQNAQIEMARMEWLHDTALMNRVPGTTPAAAGAFSSEQTTGIRWWSRKQVLENIRGSIAAISRATEGLQKSELASVSAEEKLERTMGWVAGGGGGGGGGGSGRGISGVSQEFREHMLRRKQVLWAGQEQAIALVRICVAVLEFEASREGYLESSSSSGDGKAWQQAYQKLIGRLEGAYLSFTSCDAEWKSAEKSLEAASASLSNVLNELQIVATEADPRGAELQAMLSELKQLTIEASTSVSGLCKVLRTHSALTSETAVLEEVASLTEAAEAASDVHSLAREAIAERKRLISELKKVHNVVVPLEPLLSSTTNSLTNEPEELLSIIKSGQPTLLQALDVKVKEAVAELPAAGSIVLDAAQKLHLALTSLGRAASVDTGGITKSAEATEESQPVSSSTEDGIPPETSPQPGPDRIYEAELVEEDEAWISPPGSQSQVSEGGGSSSDHQPESQQSEQKPVSRERLRGASADGSLVFSEADKLHSGEARSGHEQKQHSSKGSSSNVLSLPQSANVEYHSRVVRGTAVNVLKRVRTKLEGRDIDETGQLSIAEQVDHLLRQATSVNNLCNMYEGWTPWI